MEKRPIFLLVILFSLISLPAFSACAHRMSPLDLEGPVVRWNIVAFDKSLNGNLGEFLLGISDILEDPRGWQAAGIDFQNTGNPQKTQIVIVVAKNLNEFKRICGRDANIYKPGCVLPQSNGHQCVIGLYGGATYRPILTAIINHEVGHCLLGSGHTSTGLMKAKNDFPVEITDGCFPSENDLQRVRERIGK